MSLLWLAASRGLAQDFLIDSDDFGSWAFAEGLVNATPQGITVKRFGTTYNAVADIDQHSSIVIGEYGKRPVRTPSNQADGDRIRDQDPRTWWQPDPADPVQLWWIELDLGRAVVADKIRVLFPDEEGARPFSFFSLYTSPGIPVFGGTGKRIFYNRVGRPVNNNTESTVEFDLRSPGLRGAAGAHLDTTSTEDWDIVRFVRFEAAGATPDAALAEIQVRGVGFNLSSMVGTPTRRTSGEPHWGGTTWTSKDRECDGCGKGSGADEMLDEDVGFRTWTIEASDKGDWRVSGVWQVVDYGSVFRVNRIIFFPVVAGRSPVLYGFERDKQGPWTNFDLLVSDGTPSNNADPLVEGPYHYDLLSEVVNGTDPNTDARFRSHYGRHLFDFTFEPRPLRLLLWRVTRVPQFSRAVQLFVFHAEGYPAQVQVESADLYLGGARSLRAVEWEAEVPPGTRIEVDTQTGNGFDSIMRYYLSNGLEVTKEAYDAARERNRGPIVQDRVRDGTWSTWSLPHRFSGQAFESPSPRQWLRARVRLISEDGGAMPTLHSLRFAANTPVVAAGLRGAILPREAFVDSLQAFRYTITPSGSTVGDTGFDQVVIALPRGAVDVEVLGTTVSGTTVAVTSRIWPDSLVVQLPPPAVRRDRVEVVFRARLAESPTVFSAHVTNTTQERNTQGVVPEAFGADQVFLPDAVDGRSVVRNLTHTATFSPNGDGVNDEYELRFTLVKTDREPRVSVYDLAGRLVAELERAASASSRGHYKWDGADSGVTVPTGIYIVRVAVDTDARSERICRTVHVVY